MVVIIISLRAQFSEYFQSIFVLQKNNNKIYSQLVFLLIFSFTLRMPGAIGLGSLDEKKVDVGAMISSIASLTNIVASGLL